MQYVLFLTLFLGLPLTLIIVRLSGRLSGRAVTAIGMTTTIALISTALAANFLAARGAVYYDPTKSLGITLGYLPVEEYLYFALQGFFVCGVTLLLWRRLHREDFE